MSNDAAKICLQLNQTLGQSKFSVADLVTISGIGGYESTLYLDDNNHVQQVALIQDSEGVKSPGHYPFKEGYRIFKTSSKSVTKACSFWKLDKLSQQMVSDKTSKFIKMNIKEFNLNRVNASYSSVVKVPWNNWVYLDKLLYLFGTVIVEHELTSTRPANEENISVTLEDYRKYYSEVGLEYVKVKKSGKVYIAVYRHVDDKSKGIAPKFFAVYQLGNRLREKRLVMFIHNYNEDEKLHYLAANYKELMLGDLKH